MQSSKQHSSRRCRRDRRSGEGSATDTQNATENGDVFTNIGVWSSDTNYSSTSSPHVETLHPEAKTTESAKTRDLDRTGTGYWGNAPSAGARWEIPDDAAAWNAAVGVRLNSVANQLPCATEGTASDAPSFLTPGIAVDLPADSQSKVASWIDSLNGSKASSRSSRGVEPSKRKNQDSGFIQSTSVLSKPASTFKSRSAESLSTDVHRHSANSNPSQPVPSGCVTPPLLTAQRIRPSSPTYKSSKSCSPPRDGRSFTGSPQFSKRVAMSDLPVEQLAAGRSAGDDCSVSASAVPQRHNHESNAAIPAPANNVAPHPSRCSSVTTNDVSLANSPTEDLWPNHSTDDEWSHCTGRSEEAFSLFPIPGHAAGVLPSTKRAARRTEPIQSSSTTQDLRRRQNREARRRRRHEAWAREKRNGTLQKSKPTHPFVANTTVRETSYIDGGTGAPSFKQEVRFSESMGEVHVCQYLGKLPKSGQTKGKSNNFRKMVVIVNDSIVKGDLFDVNRQLSRCLPIDYWYNGRTPLMTAILHGQTAIASMLLKKGANVNKCCHLEGPLQGYRPIHLAIAAKNEGIIKLLIQFGATYESVTGTVSVNTIQTTTREQRSSLPDWSWWVELRDQEEYPTKQRTSNEKEERISMLTSLHVAVKHHCHKLIPAIVESHNMEINVHDGFRETALMLATRLGCKECVATLLRHNPHTEWRDRHKRTLLHLAVISRSLEIMLIVLSQNRRVNCVDKFGMTPLLLACELMWYDGVQLLLKAGASNTSTIPWDSRPNNIPSSSCYDEIKVDVPAYRSALMFVLLAYDANRSYDPSRKDCSELLKLLLDAGAVIRENELLYVIKHCRVNTRTAFALISGQPNLLSERVMVALVLSHNYQFFSVALLLGGTILKIALRNKLVRKRLTRSYLLLQSAVMFETGFCDSIRVSTGVEPYTPNFLPIPLCEMRNADEDVHKFIRLLVLYGVKMHSWSNQQDFHIYYSGEDQPPEPSEAFKTKQLLEQRPFSLEFHACVAWRRNSFVPPVIEYLEKLQSCMDETCNIKLPMKLIKKLPLSFETDTTTALCDIVDLVDLQAVAKQRLDVQKYIKERHQRLARSKQQSRQSSESGSRLN